MLPLNPVDNSFSCFYKNSWTHPLISFLCSFIVSTLIFCGPRFRLFGNSLVFPSCSYHVFLFTFLFSVHYHTYSSFVYYVTFIVSINYFLIATRLFTGGRGRPYKGPFSASSGPRATLLPTCLAALDIFICATAEACISCRTSIIMESPFLSFYDKTAVECLVRETGAQGRHRTFWQGV